MRWVVETAAIALAFWWTPALAEPLRDCDPRMVCRAMYPFGHSSTETLKLGCGRDAIAVEGIVAEVQNQTGKCTRVIVHAGVQANPPERLLIHMSSCVVWNGRLGATLRGFIRRDPSDLSRFDAVAYCAR